MAKAKRKRQRLTVFGLGYVGLSTAVCLASRGVRTTGVEVDRDRLELLRRGRVPFEEKGVGDLLKRSVKAGGLSFTDSYSRGVAESEVLMVAVGTPSSEDGATDLSQVKSAIEMLAKELGKTKDYRVIVVKSTVPAGTTSGLVRETLERVSGRRLGEFGLASNPEFLREGAAVEDSLHPDRIVIGSSDSKSAATLEGFYRAIYGKGMPPVLKTNPTNAELIKYASNAFLATRITFANELANLCNNLEGADISIVAKGMGMDRRIGSHYLKAGLGWGGSCLPKDISSLLNLAEKVGVKLAVADATKKSNEGQPLAAVKLAENLIGGLEGKRVAILGLSFKPGTDDMRDAVSVKIAESLLGRGATVTVYDPKAMQNARKLLGEKVVYSSSARGCVEGADCCIIATEWEEFAKLRPGDFKRLMKAPAVVDGRRIFDPELYRNSGIRFAAVGLGPVPDTNGKKVR